MLTTATANAKRERGAVTVETAFASVFLVLLLTAITDFANMHYTRSTLQHAVSQATRFAVTGNTVVDPNDSSKRLSREASILHLVRKISGLTSFDEGDIEIYVVGADGGLTPGPGGPGDVIMVRASYRVDIVTPGLATLFPNGEYSFTCSTRFRNEEFTSVTPTAAGATRELA
jgi:hypothetical protein